MKLAHLADPHLGLRQYHRQTASGINQREADVARAFRLAIDGVIEARPDAVVVAGDLFHAVRPSNAAIVFAFRQFQRLREALPDAPVILIAGNHDTPRSVETGTILRLFEEIGVNVAAEEARQLVYPALGLSVLAVPHQALVGTERISLRAEGAERHRVLVLHGEIEGVLPAGSDAAEYGGAPVALSEIGPDEWSYVALGPYHVQHEVAPRPWYAGSLDYIGPNLWGERADERVHDASKGWLLADLDTGVVHRRPVPLARAIHDLDPIVAADWTAAELDAAIAARLAAVPGGIQDQIVRLVVRDVPRHIARALDHAAIRAYKTEALHFTLDLRRPEVHRTVGVGAPGRRQTLPEIVRDYLEHRPLPAELDRAAFVALGAALMDTVERELAGA